MHSIHIRLSFLLLMHAFVSATPIAIRQAAINQGSSMIAARRIYPGDPANHHGQASTLNVHHSALRTRSDIVNSSGSDGNFAGKVVIAQPDGGNNPQGQDIAQAGSSSSSGSSSARVGAPSTGQTYTGTVSGVTPIQGTGNDTGRTAGQVTVGNDVEVTVVLGGGTSEPTNPSGSQGDNGSKSGDASTGSTNGSTNPNGGAQGNNGQGSGESANTGANSSDASSTGSNDGGSGSPSPSGSQPQSAQPASSTENNNGSGGSAPPDTQPQQAPDTENNNGGSGSPNGAQPQNTQPAPETGNNNQGSGPSPPSGSQPADTGNSANGTGNPNNPGNGSGAPAGGNGSTADGAPDGQDNPNSMAGGGGNDDLFNLVVDEGNGMDSIHGKVVGGQ